MFGDIKIIVDECIAKSTRRLLKENEFTIFKVYDILNPRIEDSEIFRYANNNKLPLITHNKGFGLFFHFSRTTTPTIIIIHVLSPHPEATNLVLENFI